jgi:hypothetical protein
LTEVIATQAFPSHALPSSPEQRAKWYRTKYLEKSDLWQGDLEGWEKEHRGRRLTSSKRLLLRGRERDLVFSSSRVAASPVTRCVLNDPLIEKTDEVFLRVMEAVQIEQWFESCEIVLLNAQPKDRLKRATAVERATYKLPVTSTVTGFTKFLHFYDHTPDAKIAHYQVDFRRDAFKADWQLKLGPEWFATLRQTWTDKWFAGLGRFNQIARKNNAVLELKITPKKLYIIFNRDPDASGSEDFEFPSDIRTLKRTQTTLYLSKDLAPVLFNLADAPVIGALSMAGNAHALVFRYSTLVGKFEIAIPTLGAKGKRGDDTLFYALGRQ